MSDDSWSQLALDAPPARMRALIDLWEARKRGRRFPARRDFELPDLRHWARDIQFVDVVHDPDKGRRYRFRLVGTGINGIDGMEATGRFADEVFARNYRTIFRGYDEAVDRARPVISQFKRSENRRGTVMIYDRAILPLAEEGETISGLLVYLVEH